MQARYRYRLRVTPKQARQIQEVFDSCRFVWNTALGRWRDLWEHERISLSGYDMCQELTDWRGCYEWLAAIPRRPQVAVLDDLYVAISQFYRRTRNRPRFKKKGQCVSARWIKKGFSVVDGGFALSVAGGRTNLRVVCHRPLPSEPSSVTVDRDACGRWWASFVVEVEPTEHVPTGLTTGLDVGLTTFATTEHPENDVPNPRFGKSALVTQRRRDRALSRSQDASKRGKKARLRRARQHAKTAARRHHHAHTTAARLARTYDRIGVEKLNVKGLVRNRSLSRAISDAAWSDFIAALDWQFRKTGRELTYLPAPYTSRKCSRCGVVKAKLPLSERTFSCDGCGLTLDRDRNAARNLNPGRDGPGAPVDGRKTLVPTGIRAARGAESPCS